MEGKIENRFLYITFYLFNFDFSVTTMINNSVKYMIDIDKNMHIMKSSLKRYYMHIQDVYICMYSKIFIVIAVERGPKSRPNFA